MNTTLQKPVSPTVKYALFGLTLLLLAASALGFAYWKSNPPLAFASSLTPEQLYYKQVVYAVNEMHNQIEAYHENPTSASDAERVKNRAYVDSLMTAIGAPSEELSIAKYIADQLYASYQDYIGKLASGSSDAAAAYGQASDTYAQFRQNAEILRLLSAYSGVNIECH